MSGTPEIALKFDVNKIFIFVQPSDISRYAFLSITASGGPVQSPKQGSAQKLHYAWIVAGVTFLILLATAGIRATPAILMVPLEHEFGWTRAAISAAVAMNIALFGIIGPFAASLMSRYGLRRIVLMALALLSAGVALSSTMHTQWQLTLFWACWWGRAPA